MRRDLDRLAWAWMLLGGAVGLVHVGLVLLGFREGWFAPFVLPESMGLIREAVLAALWLSILAFVIVPAGASLLLASSLLERRRGALALFLFLAAPALVFVPPFGLLVVGFTVWTLGDQTVRSRLAARAEDPLAWRIGAVVRLHDRPVSESVAERGSPLELALDGAPPTLAWASRDRVAVIGPGGSEQVIDPTHPARFAHGPVDVSVAVVPELRVRRWVPLTAFGSLLWLGVVLGSGVTVQQAEIAWSIVACPVFGVGCPASGEADMRVVSAEYLARLLKEDLAGEDVGVIEDRIDRPEAERKADDPDRFYLPAGNVGPITRMGGAEDVASEPVRAPQVEETALPVPKKKKPAPPAVTAENASPVKPEAAAEDDGAADAERDSPMDEGDAEDTPPDRPAEEREGWGIQDWYDEQDKRHDDLEIELMIKVSKQRLRIDPNDPSALSILSYYQYLAEDYEAAEATYDKYIQVLPEDAAGYNNKALVYKRRGEYQKEEGLYRLALAFEPDDVTAMNNLGVNLAHQKRFDEALQVMKRLEVLDPGDPYADLHRSKIYAEMGDDAKALEYLEKALRGMAELDTLHHIEFRQDIRLDPSFARLRETERFRAVLIRYYGKDSPLQEP